MNRAGLLLLLVLLPAGGAAAQDSAAAAWNAGDLARAERLYAHRLAEDSSDVRALHRMALMLAWTNRFPGSLRLFNRLLSVAPGNVDARLDRARTLAWAERYDEAAAAYAELLAHPAAGRDAALGLAQVYAWRGRLDSAVALYRQLLEHDATDAAALAGLVQAYRWDGRSAAALLALQAAPAPADDEGLQRERRYARAMVGPLVAPALTRETDSDGNGITTLDLSTSWRPTPRVGLTAEGYARSADEDRAGVARRTAYGVIFEGTAFLEPGWTLTGGLGASGSDVAGAGGAARVLARIASPPGARLSGVVAYAREPLDATARLIANGITYQQLALSGRLLAAPAWRIDVGWALARFAGTDVNHRNAVFAALGHRLTRAWTLGVRGRALGFENDLNDGYFDPSFFGIGEAFARWRGEFARWSVELEAAPGLQQITGVGNPQFTVQGTGAVGYEVVPGRRVDLAVLLSRSGLSTFATPEAGYRYVRIRLGGSWVF